MKRTFIVLISLLTTTFSFGQSIVSSNKLWNNLIEVHTPLPIPEYRTEHIKFTIDTLINSLTYKKVERSLDENQLNWSSYGFIRENANKQIYYKISAADTERLLYDLNVQMHDTILVYGLTTIQTVPGFLYPNSYYVQNIDSLLIGQSYRKRINLTYPSDTAVIREQWIDSTGSMSGMLHNYWQIYYGYDIYSLLCYFEDGILKYKASSSCFIATSINENEALTPSVTISPNPVSGISTLEIKGIEETNSLSICFYNIFGVEILKRTGEKQMKISKNNFLSGIYFYQVTFKNRIIQKGKIIIN